MSANEVRVVRIVANGPVAVEGPARIELPDGSRGRIRPVHSRDLHLPAQQELSGRATPVTAADVAARIQPSGRRNEVSPERQHRIR